MEPEGSQDSSTGSYPEPYQSNPHHPILYLWDPFWYCLPTYVSFIKGIRPGPRPRLNVRNKLSFYGEELLAPRRPPKLEAHSLSAVCDCLFNIFAASLHNWGRLLRPQLEDAPCRGDKGPT
jgi:hypothetical protein